MIKINRPWFFELWWGCVPSILYVGDIFILWAGHFCIFAPACNSWRGVNLQKKPAQGGWPGFFCIFTPALHTLLKCCQMMVWICINIQITTSELDFSVYLHQVSCCNHHSNNKQQCYQIIVNIWLWLASKLRLHDFSLECCVKTSNKPTVGNMITKF